MQAFRPFYSSLILPHLNAAAKTQQAKPRPVLDLRETSHQHGIYVKGIGKAAVTDGGPGFEGERLPCNSSLGLPCRMLSKYKAG